MSNNNQNIDSKDFLIGALVGGIVGAASALLLAPKSGRELRGDINDQAVYLKDKGNELTSIAKDKSSAIAKTVSDQSTQVADKVKELTTNIRRDLDKWRSKSEDVHSEAKEAYGEITEKVQDELQESYQSERKEEDLVEQKY